MIKIISGVYGHKGDNGILVAKTPKDPPFSLSQVEETRLVDRRVAEFVNNYSPNTIETPQCPNDDLVYNINMKRKELDKIAESYGISTTQLNSKTEVIVAIEQLLAEQEKTKSDAVDSDEDTDDEQPDLNADDTVVEV